MPRWLWACAEARTDRERAAITFDRLFVAFKRDQRIADVVVRFGAIRIDRQGTLELRDGVLMTAELIHCGAEVAVGLGVVRLQGDRLLVMRDRFVMMVQRGERQAEIVRGLGKARL